MAGNPQLDADDPAAGPLRLALAKFSEPNLTKAMAAALGRDQLAPGAFARGLVRIVAPEADPPPKRLECAANVWFYGRNMGPDRVADITFFSRDSKYVLFLEAKFGAPTGKKQVGDYIRAKRESIAIGPPEARRVVPPGARIRVALVGRKALAPTDVESALMRFPRRKERWLGAATWLELVPVLRAPGFAEDAFNEGWRTLVTHYEGANGLGIGSGGIYDPGQLLDGTVFEIRRSMKARGCRCKPVPNNAKTETIVGRRGQGAFMKVDAALPRARVRRLRVRVDLQAADLILRLSDDRPGRVRNSTVPAEAAADLGQFRRLLERELMAFLEV